MIAKCQRGFTLLESLVALTLTTIAVLGVAGAVTASLYGSARAETKLLLAADAANVLTDLRAASAYDPALLAALGGRSAQARLAFPGPHGPRLVTIAAAVAPRAARGQFEASVTATAADGTSVSESVTLVQEAPAPGSRTR